MNVILHSANCHVHAKFELDFGCSNTTVLCNHPIDFEENAPSDFRTRNAAFDRRNVGNGSRLLPSIDYLSDR